MKIICPLCKIECTKILYQTDSNNVFDNEFRCPNTVRSLGFSGWENYEMDKSHYFQIIYSDDSFIQETMFTNKYYISSNTKNGKSSCMIQSKVFPMQGSLRFDTYIKPTEHIDQTIDKLYMLT